MGVVVGIGAIAKDLEELEVGGVFGGLRERADVGCIQKLGEDKGRGVGGCTSYEVGCCTRGGGGFGQCKEGL